MKKKPKKITRSFLWVTDPWKTLDHPNDTTLRLAREAILLGHTCFWCEASDISLIDSKVTVHATPLEVQGDTVVLAYTQNAIKAATEFHQIHYRIDPPVTLAYLHPLQLLHTVKSARTEIVNPAPLLLTQSEKLIPETLGLSAKESIPTLFASRLTEITQFGRTHGEIVVKPFHSAQSLGVERFSFKTEESARVSETALKARLSTAGSDPNHSPLLVVQPFLEGVVKQGEIRLWFVDGKLLIAARKKPKSGEFKIDMDAGGFLEKAKLTAAEKSVAGKLSRTLKKLKIRLAAIDLIGGRVSDFNFTSPGLLVQCERIYGENFARKVIQSLVKA